MVLAARPPVSITRTVGLASDRPFKTRSPSPGPPVAASPRRARRPRRRPTLAPLTRASGRALPQGPSGSRHAGERQDDSENSRHRARGPTRRQDGQAGGGSTPQHRFEARFGAGPNQDGTRSHIALQDKRHTGSVARLPAVPHRTPSLGYSQLRSASTGGSTPRRSAQRVPATSCTTGKSFRVAIQRKPAWVPARSSCSSGRLQGVVDLPCCVWRGKFMARRVEVYGQATTFPAEKAFTRSNDHVGSSCRASMRIKFPPPF